MRLSTIWDKQRLSKIGILGLWLLLWQGLYLVVGEDLLLASPFAVFVRLLQLAGLPSFWYTICWTLGRIMAGFLSGLFLGAAIAFASARSRLLCAFFELPMNIIKATPVASFVILALVWIRSSNLSMFIAFLMVLPLVWSNVREGIRNTDPKLLEMAKVFRLSRAAALKNITIPTVLPYFLSAAKTGLGFSWKSGIAGEVLAIPSAAIGTQLYNAKIYLETTDLFVWTAVIILLSMLLERLMVAGINSIVRRMNRLTREVKA